MPFYKMDVNGYIFHVNEAIADYASKANLTKEHQIRNIDFVCLESMVTAFGQYTSWKDLADEQSDFVLFLQSNCAYKGA